MHVRTGLRIFAATLGLLVALGSIAPALADVPGISSGRIVLGSSRPLSGPAAAYGNIGKGMAAYFSYVNDRGGVNGRTITWLDRDDGYSPTQALTAAQELVERDDAFAIVAPFGTAVNVAIRPYLNQSGTPQLFVGSGARTWGADYRQYPWTIGWQPGYATEAVVYARDIISVSPRAKIAIL